MWIATVVSVVGLAVSTYASYESAQAQKKVASYNAKLAENEAIAKEQQAHAESLQMQKSKERLLASQRAGFAKAGAVSTAGTPLLLMAEQAGTAELDILNQQRNRAMEVTALQSEASLHRFKASQTGTAGLVGTALSGVGSSLSTYNNAKGKTGRSVGYNICRIVY